MEFVKKLLVLCILPVSVLAMEDENKKGRSLLRKQLNHKNLRILSLYQEDLEHQQNILRMLNELKIKPTESDGPGFDKSTLNVGDLELAIIEKEQKARKVYDPKIENLSKRLREAEDKLSEVENKNIELHKKIDRHIYRKAAIYRSLRFVGFSAFTTILAVSAFIKIKSSIPNIFWHRTQ